MKSFLPETLSHSKEYNFVNGKIMLDVEMSRSTSQNEQSPKSYGNGWVWRLSLLKVCWVLNVSKIIFFAP